MWTGEAASGYLSLGKAVTSPPPLSYARQNRPSGSIDSVCSADGMAGRWKAVCLEAACQPQGSHFLSHFFLSEVKNESSRWLKESWALCQYIYTIILNQKRFPHGRFVRPTSELFSPPSHTPYSASLPGTPPCRCVSGQSLEEMS